MFNCKIRFSNLIFLLFCFIITKYVASTSSSASFRVLSSGKEIPCNGDSCSICVSAVSDYFSKSVTRAGRSSKIDANQLSIKRKREAISSETSQNCDDWKKSGEVTLELAVFADHALYQEFHRRYPSNSTQLKLKMQEFILSIVQQGKELFLSPTLKPKVHIEVVEYKVILHKFRRFSFKKVRQDMPSYMDSFCRYQRQLNIPKRWDHAVLFTGFDLIHTIHQGNFAGYSSAKSVCGPMSCSLVEASSFKSAYTLAHEIGHSLGMNHDNGSDACPATCCVMSSIVFSGSHNWSRCSISEFHDYLESIPCRKYCLHKPDGGQKSKFSEAMPIMPGQAYTAFDQCRHYYGSCSKPYYEQLETICGELWCTYHDGTMRMAHAALEGTHCSDGKWCRFGKCVLTDTLTLEPRDGQWSSWAPLPSDGSCGHVSCSKREIFDQLSIRRQLRSCSNPSPNNGGAECQGEMHRGVVCNDESESENLIDEETSQEENTNLQTVVEFATKICTGHKIRAQLENDTFVSLSGEGFQRATYDSEPNACYVWCSTVNASFTSYTFFDPFPDGTPCGTNRFCVSGKCMERQRCNSTLTLLTSDFTSDCQTNTAPKVNKTVPKITVFSTWSTWSECSKTCGIGVKRRLRLCSPANSTACMKLTNTHQYQFCRGKTNRCQIQSTPVATTAPTNELEKDTRMNSVEKMNDKTEVEIESDPDTETEIEPPDAESEIRKRGDLIRDNVEAPIATTAATTLKAKPTTMATTSTIRRKATTAAAATTKRKITKPTISTTSKAKAISTSAKAIPSTTKGKTTKSTILRKTKPTPTPTSKPNVGRWSEWSSWSECNTTCNGYQRVTRTCTPTGALCRGPETKKRVCNPKQKC